MIRWRGVFSHSGGLGKEWTLSFGFGGIVISVALVVFPMVISLT